MDVPSEQSAEHHYLGQKAQPASSETRLPIFVRYKDIADAGICDCYLQLYNMIDNDGFPPGMLVSPNVRAPGTSPTSRSGCRCGRRRAK